MGFLMAGCYCANPPFPSFLIHFLVFLLYIQRVVIWTLDAVGLGILLDEEFQVPPPSFLVPAQDPQSPLPLASTLIRQSLPSSTYEPPSKEECKDPGCDSAAASCTVCLYELQAGDEVRRLGGCRHVFHVCCIDPWINIGRRTCPLCRAELVPQEMLRQAMIAAGKNIPGHPAVDAVPDGLDSYSSLVSLLDDDGLHYSGDGDYYPVQ